MDLRKTSAGMSLIISSVGHSKFIPYDDPHTGSFRKPNFNAGTVVKSIGLKHLLITSWNSYYCLSKSVWIWSLIFSAYLLIICKFSAQCASSYLIRVFNRTGLSSKHAMYSCSLFVNTPVGFSLPETQAFMIYFTNWTRLWIFVICVSTSALTCKKQAT